MRISHFAADHPAVIGMLVIALCVFGAYSFLGLNMEFMGDISLPTVEILAYYPGAGAADVEHDVTDILEEEFVTLPDFTSIESSSYDSFCWVTVTFRDGIDPYDMLPEIRDRIRRLLPDLPDGLQGEPTAMVAGATMMPVFMFAVDGGSDGVSLTRYLDEQVIARITRIPGVANVEVLGAHDLEVRIVVQLERLQATGIPILQVQQALAAANIRLPVGEALRYGRSTPARFDGSFSSVNDIASLPVGADGQGTIIRLSDIAEVSLTTARPDYHVDSEGRPLMLISVTKRLDGNTLKISRGIRAVIEDLERSSGGAIRCTVLSDDSRNVEASLMTVVSSGALGVLMAVVVIFLFLADVRATTIISLSIPLSIMFTLIGMRVVGLTLNLLSLSGLVIALGMVVDGSIVMLEQVYRHYKAGELGVIGSIKAGADEVGASILASTTTTVVVFIPITLLPGIVGMIIKDVGITLILALAASLVVAVAVVPFLMRVLLKPHASNTTPFSERPVAALERWYRRALQWGLGKARFILAVSAGILGLTVLTASFLGFTFIPSTDSGDFYIDMEFARGTPLETTHQKALLAEQIVRQAVPEITSMTVFSGQSSGYGFNSPEKAYAKVLLSDRWERTRSVHAIMLDVQHRLSEQIAGSRIEVTNGGYDKLLGYVSGGGGYGLTLVGEDLERLHEAATRIGEVLSADPEVVAVRTDASFDSETLVIDASHELMGSVGVSSYEAALTTMVLFRGIDIGLFTHTDGNRYPIRLESDLREKPFGWDALATITVPTASKGVVSFADITSLRTERTISQINHSDRAKTITVSATLVSEDASGINSRMNAYLDQEGLPAGIESRQGGIIELIGDSLGPVGAALAIGVFLVYTVMAIQFERFRQPLIVMVSIPFCLIGVVGGLLAFGSTISLLAVTGVIALGGIVVNNAIILIDYINLLRERYAGRLGLQVLPLHESFELLDRCIAEGASSRIRPILMTTLTTIFGVVPLAFSKGSGAEIYAPLGQAIAGGLVTSTLITLFLVPVLYRMTERRRIVKAQSACEPTDVIQGETHD